MGRLIDADAFIEYLGLNTEDAREENIGEIVTLEDFDRQPTGYNPEKIIGELSTLAELAEGRYIVEADNYAMHEHKCWRKAIEIVRKGGVE